MSRRVSRLMMAGSLVVGLAGTAAALGPAASATGAHRAKPNLPAIGRLIPSLKNELLPTQGGTVTSLNWSGYAVTPGSGITGVSTQFKVPSAALLPPGFAATWAGIGGYDTSDLIQAGVGENFLLTNPLTGPQYYAWYEILPAAETPISGCAGDPNCTVGPGDAVGVNIARAGANLWNVSISNSTRHWSWSQNIPYASSGSSAEWILEAPTVGLQTLMAGVGTVHFVPTDTYSTSTGSYRISQGSPTKIVLSPGLIDEATPSALASDGESFNDCSYAQTCPAP